MRYEKDQSWTSSTEVEVYDNRRGEAGGYGSRMRYADRERPERTSEHRQWQLGREVEEKAGERERASAARAQENREGEREVRNAGGPEGDG